MSSRSDSTRTRRPRLVHLNGMPGSGKSTVARLLAERDPGSLALDLDSIAGLVGGWADDFMAALDVARELGREMAGRHLRNGRDVFLPQLVTVYDDRVHDPAFRETARVAGADHVQVALTTDEGLGAVRLRERAPANPVEAWIQTTLTGDDDASVGRIRGHLRAYWDRQVPDLVVDTTGMDVEQTSVRVEELLDRR